ncbi:hypothetical protein M3Y98_00796600 [Aphelenchoides besseyi]|nr:hypothetical protein M3Y98_00796600 [Aphelenchoides besseyi]KAI6211995.1 hypothetical protein M3Y96_00493400 [Aphelenchoides besseyi]
MILFTVVCLLLSFVIGDLFKKCCQQVENRLDLPLQEYKRYGDYPIRNHRIASILIEALEKDVRQPITKIAKDVASSPYVLSCLFFDLYYLNIPERYPRRFQHFMTDCNQENLRVNRNRRERRFSL